MGGKEDNFIFEQKDKYVDIINDQIATSSDNSKVETIHLQSESDVYAWIPEDFNLEVTVEGSITGLSMKDTKLISKQCELITHGVDSPIMLRKLRNDTCVIKALDGPVHVGSYIETGMLQL